MVALAKQEAGDLISEHEAVNAVARDLLRQDDTILFCP
jgi:hypothetical protein